ncbi:hypothetical protein WOLCODRAFT_157033 [Wolfiporia cocos MD-104 SS10]|uniref:Uncharacterized protein n=1 Tax=Wolfiporia cocos (strain MD-104) TaxID=742152 RepID=A0A2H3JC60_WOLCO|nr:hypothetical protein WOLCODRAFT_157033 [Wolfiporia cocos MD-104 SS10]
MTGLVPVATNIYVDASGSRPYVVMVAGVPICTMNFSLSEDFLNRRKLEEISDSVVIAATWLYALPWAKHIPDTRGRPPLMFIILRDGTAYFIALLLLNTSQIVLEHLYYSMDIVGTDYISQFQPPISSILVSRFIFDLRQHIDRGKTDSNVPSFVSEKTRSGGSIHFESRLVGNMGAPLDHSISNSLLFDDGDDIDEDYTGCNEELEGWDAI